MFQFRPKLAPLSSMRCPALRLSLIGVLEERELRDRFGTEDEILPEGSPVRATIRLIIRCGNWQKLSLK